jgi:F-type H+-transporting ATPase subunit a
MPHVPIALYPLFIVIEFLSNLIRPFVLCIRLFANMMGGHVVILAFISLIFILGAIVAPVSVFFVALSTRSTSNGRPISVRTIWEAIEQAPGE